MRYALLAALALSAGISCQHAGRAIAPTLKAAQSPQVRQLLAGPSRLRVELDPPVPPQIEPGEEWLVSLEVRFESGLRCRFCQASWVSSAPAVASVSTDRACTRGSCTAVLEARAPGNTLLTLRVCQSYESECREWEFPLAVMR